MKIRCLLIAALALASTNAVAGQYRTCEIWSGKKNTCSMPYDGQAVILDQGLYKTCEIWAGKKNTCSMPYDGQAVILDQGLYKICEIWAGKKNTCSMPYDGQTVIFDRKIDSSSSRKHCCQ
ncbi:uncharacterized protein ZMO1_ZMOp36x022 (plasmid) [Zymomonas mobilis subsp. mobilis ZM4 = ATCC 31821]|uniref:hypothetical protein n=1 Tax=Zymomonas mobilis TaxID=542 RepID=UPI000B2C49F1|nr:hypothetical protein [Zymomonas mobilis]AVZ43211.2 uncharacterized protein ZMO1_ZMOp36x022 [Zymomonas mobilis subsp. mobilis ZM4 = ATCC 31821]UBQ08692.1 hypothetical protein LB319_09475 [Zymomonas mobilis]